MLTPLTAGEPLPSTDERLDPQVERAQSFRKAFEEWHKQTQNARKWYAYVLLGLLGVSECGQRTRGPMILRVWPWMPADMETRQPPLPWGRDPGPVCPARGWLAGDQSATYVTLGTHSTTLRGCVP